MEVKADLAREVYPVPSLRSSFGFFGRLCEQRELRTAFVMTRRQIMAGFRTTRHDADRHPCSTSLSFGCPRLKDSTSHQRTFILSASGTVDGYWGIPFDCDV